MCHPSTGTCVKVAWPRAATILTTTLIVVPTASNDSQARATAVAVCGVAVVLTGALLFVAAKRTRARARRAVEGYHTVDTSAIP